MHSEKTQKLINIFSHMGMPAAVISTMAVEYKIPEDKDRIPVLYAKSTADLVRVAEVLAETRKYTILVIDNVLGIIDQQKMDNTNKYVDLKNVTLALGTIAKEHEITIIT